MVQKFNGDVGQVAGRDVKNSSAQASVNIHLHNEAEPKRYISDRQRRAIGAKVYELEAKTGVEKLMVYRRLMTVFKFQSMDEMPRDRFERVMRYLDGWLRNGTTEQSVPQAQPEVKEPATASSGRPMPTEPLIVPPMPEGAIAESTRSVPTPASILKKRSPWLAISITVIGVLIAAVTAYIATHRHGVVAQSQIAAASPQCEYAGDRYTIGSVVRQAGLLQRCEATEEHAAAWRPLAPSSRR